MKFLVRILSIYLLLLSMVPCADGNGGVVELINQLLQEEDEHIHHYTHEEEGSHKDCGGDPCTPFCICSCCSLTLNIPVKEMVFILIPDSNPSNTPFTIPNLISLQVSRTIWDPPQYA